MPFNKYKRFVYLAFSFVSFITVGLFLLKNYDLLVGNPFGFCPLEATDRDGITGLARY